MLQRASLVAVVIIVGAAFATTPAAKSWQIESIDSNFGTTDVYPSSSISLDTAGNSHIVYDDSNDGIKYAYKDGAGWHFEVIDKNGSIIGAPPFVLDPRGNPHIVYQKFDYVGSKRLSAFVYYTYKDSSGWHRELVNQSNALVNRSKAGTVNTANDFNASFLQGPDDPQPSLALDSSGRPHVIYYDYGEVFYAYKDGNKWRHEVIDEYGWYSPATLSLDASGQPNVVYTAKPQTANYPKIADLLSKYAYRSGGSWHIEYFPDKGIGGFCQLDTDSSGKLHIAYWKDQDTLKYAYRESGTWHSESVDKGDFQIGFAGSVVSSRPALDTDSSGMPSIAYYAGGGDHRVKYAHKDNSGWHLETIDTNINTEQRLSVVIGASGTPHISYYNPNSHSINHAFNA